MTGLLRFGVGLGVMAVLLGGPLALAVEVNPHLSRGTLVIAKRVSLTMEPARTLGEKMRGLSRRPGLESVYGTLFAVDPPQPISLWMKDMRISLDIIWMDPRGTEHGDREGDLPADAIRPGADFTATADLVPEVPAGCTSQHQIRVSDKVQAILHEAKRELA